jgi:predicted acylesterase/phospholipase RssA
VSSEGGDATVGTPDVSTEEVRVAMALNGGVSLAVWMGGCSVELDCARRAHLPGSGGADPAQGQVYRMLCATLDRELVIDIMSGSSAGGINGALLAGVITHGRRLDPAYLRGRWIDLGDFSSLLQPLSERDPRSLMSGQLFYTELHETFAAVLGTSQDAAGNAASELAPDARPAPFTPVLDITTTNLAGEERLFRDDWGETLAAREYRACFRFRQPIDYTAENLAMAARASASFPLAFEPWSVDDADSVRLASFAAPRWVLDGGLLDNAPIRLALAAIPSRSANRQVKRYVCYINGDPPEHQVPSSSLPPQPTLENVLGAIVGLPRKAPFADELAAIETASRRSALNSSAVVPLLSIDLEALVTTADGLLPIYRSRRQLRSLQDLLGQPRDAELAFARVDGAGRTLPWIPTSLKPPSGGKWSWGIETARRVHHLSLDLIRFALNESEPGGRRALLQARMEIDARLRELDVRQEQFESSPCVLGALRAIVGGPEGDVKLNLASLAGFTAPQDAELHKSVRATVETVYRVSVQLGARDGVPVGEALFGDAWALAPHLTAAMSNRFLQRALAIEVIRRAFSMDEVVEDAQALAFAQLTPFAPTPLLSPAPLTNPVRLAPSQKLTGVILGHFGAFYRASWRANDFMWGRLDAASRIVNMLLDEERARQLHKRDQRKPWETLADALLEEADAGQRWLIEEALDDAARPPDDDLRRRLRAALETDLTGGDSALTRAICVRAAQLEILREELPGLITQAKLDEQRGSAPNALELPSLEELQTPAGQIAAVNALRTGETLPKRLGLDAPAEHTGTLAIRTVTRSSLVSLAVLREGIPIGKPLQLLRAVVLPMAGIVAQHWWNRLGVMLAFVASAWFLAGRTITTMPGKPADLAHLSIWELIVSSIAVLVVAGTAAVPGIRFLWGSKSGRVAQALWFVAIAGTGAAATLGVAVGVDLNVGQLIVQPGAKGVLKILLAPTILIVFGIALVPVPLLGHRLTDLAERAWAGKASSLLALVAAGCLIGWAQAPLRHAIFDEGNWHTTVALIAVIGAPAVAVAFLFVRDPLARLWSRR